MGLWDSIFRKRKELDPISLKDVGADMHSHLIPDVDDGSKSIEDSVNLIKGLADLGFSHFITTPHIMSDVYPNTKAGLERKAEELKEHLATLSLGVSLEVSAEYFLDEHFMDLIAKKELMPFGGDKILFEMSFIEESPLLQEAIFELQSAGYTPILAHPERYTYLHGRFEKYSELAEQGVHLQLNINSVSGHYSPQVSNVSEKLIEKELISFLGSDCHHMGHVKISDVSLRHPSIHTLVNSGKLLNSTLSA